MIHGIPYAKSPDPGFDHQKICGRIHFQLENLLKNCKKCQAILPIDRRLDTETDDNVIQPDNMIYCKEVKKSFITDSPSLIFEIISPSSVLKDRVIKYKIYETQGVKYYVIIDPESKIADVFELKENKHVKIAETKNDTLNFELDDDCKIDFNFSEIWS